MDIEVTLPTYTGASQSDVSQSQMYFTLNYTQTMVCYPIRAIMDIFPEYDERFYLTVSFQNPLDYVAANPTIRVVIVDDDGE